MTSDHKPRPRVYAGKPFAHFQWNYGWGNWEQVIPEAANRRGVVTAYARPKDGTAERQTEPREDQENIDWKARFESSQALLARRTEALAPFAKAMAGFWILQIAEGAPVEDDDTVCLSHAFGTLPVDFDLSFRDFRRASEALSQPLVDQGDMGTSSSVAGAEVAASSGVKSDGLSPSEGAR